MCSQQHLSFIPCPLWCQLQRRLCLVFGEPQTVEAASSNEYSMKRGHSLGKAMGPESNRWALKTGKVDTFFQDTRGKGH